MTLRSKDPFHRYANKIKSDHFHQRRKIVEYDDTANTMTIRMTDTGLSEINEAATVYTDIKERVRMNILIVEDEVSLANALEHIMKKPVTSRMW